MLLTPLAKKLACMTVSLASIVATTTGAHAALVLDGTGFGAATAHVTYDPNAPTSNFGSPGGTTSGAAYDIFVRNDATYVYTLLKQDGSGGTSAGAFANLYFGLGSATPANGSTYGIEVTNNRSFAPGSPAYYNNNNLYGIEYNTLGGGTAIEVAIPFSYFETDPQNIGFDKVTPANPYVTLRLSQTFGFSVAGGAATYGATRLGQVVDPFVTVTNVPEPASLALVGAGLLLAGVARRKRADG